MPITAAGECRNFIYDGYIVIVGPAANPLWALAIYATAGMVMRRDRYVGVCIINVIMGIFFVGLVSEIFDGAENRRHYRDGRRCICVSFRGYGQLRLGAGAWQVNAVWEVNTFIIGTRDITCCVAICR